nr:hypothetical protein GCM10020092_062120 [Actinoplanes digitatis]
MDNPAPTDPRTIYRRPEARTPPTLPSISDYWPDAPHRIGPEPDHYSDEPTAASVDALLRSGRREHEEHPAPAEPPARSAETGTRRGWRRARRAAARSAPASPRRS